jgi:hypothetical protein
MESANGTRGRRLPVSRDPAHLQVFSEAHSPTDLRTNISRLEEATRRLNSCVTSELNSEAVAAELRSTRTDCPRNPKAYTASDRLLATPLNFPNLAQEAWAGYEGGWGGSELLQR